MHFVRDFGQPTRLRVGDMKRCHCLDMHRVTALVDHEIIVSGRETALVLRLLRSARCLHSIFFTSACCPAPVALHRRLFFGCRLLLKQLECRTCVPRSPSIRSASPITGSRGRRLRTPANRGLNSPYDCALVPTGPEIMSGVRALVDPTDSTSSTSLHVRRCTRCSSATTMFPQVVEAELVSCRTRCR